MAIPNWITLSRSTGSGNDTVIVTISPNTGAARAYTLTVGTGKISKTLSISQEAYVPPVPGNKIFYTSTDGNIVTPSDRGWTANIVSNTYVDGQGVIEFDGEINAVPVGGFQRCKTLKSMILPDGITSIGGLAFGNCQSLTEVTLPNSLTSIEGGVFQDCKSLTEVTLPDSVTSIGQYAFANCESLTSINIPPRVTSIVGYAFQNCESLTEVTLPNSVTSIGEYAFRNCKSLTEVTLPNSITRIDTGVFKNCESLTEVTIPLTVIYIWSYVFENCKSLTEVTLPNSVTSIGSYVFRNCEGLEKMIMQRTLPPTFGTDILASTTCPIIVPCGSEGAYKTATNFSQYASRIVGDCPPEPTGDTHYLASNLSYDITVRITDDDEKTIVPATTLTHNDSISWEGNDSIVIRMTSPTADTVRVRNDNGDYLTDNITLTPNVETSSPKIVMTGVERLRIVSMLMKSVKPVVEEDED